MERLGNLEYGPALTFLMGKLRLTSANLRQQLQQLRFQQHSTLHQSIAVGQVGLLTCGILLTLLAGHSTAHEGYARQRLQFQRERLSRPTAEQPPAFKPGTPGVCHLYQLSGYLAIDPQGQVVPLSEYCEQQRNWAWYETGDFWHEFREVAGAETLSYAQTLDRDKVEAYAQSICPFLANGGTMQELAEIRTDAQLPADFERAVTIAAVKTFCREHRQQIRE